MTGSAVSTRVALAVGLAAAVATGVAGYLIGHEVGEPEPGDVQRGTVFSADDGELCIEQDDKVECYRAAGLGAEVGQDVTFVVAKALVDPGNPDGGKILTLVYLAED